MNRIIKIFTSTPAVLSIITIFVAILVGAWYVNANYNEDQPRMLIKGEPQLPPGQPPVESSPDLGSAGNLDALTSKKSSVKSNQKIIKTANIEIKIKRKTAKEKLETVMRIAEITGGYVVDSDLTKGDVSTDATAVIRIPERSLKDVIAQLSKLGTVKKFTQSGRDVTNEYVDLQARIKQLKAEEVAFRRLYERASKISDLLQIQQNLSDVQTQIEQLQGQLNQLSEQVDFATINVLLTEPKIKKSPSIYDIWKRNKAIETGLSGLIGLVSIFTIGVITIFPIILLVVIVVLILRFIKRKQ